MSAQEPRELEYRVTVTQVKPRRLWGLWPERWEAEAEYRDPGDQHYSGSWNRVYESCEGLIDSFRMSMKHAQTPERAKRKAERLCARHLRAWRFKKHSETTTTVHGLEHP